MYIFTLSPDDNSVFDPLEIAIDGEAPEAIAPVSYSGNLDLEQNIRSLVTVAGDLEGHTMNSSAAQPLDFYSVLAQSIEIGVLDGMTLSTNELGESLVDMQKSELPEGAVG